MSIRVVFLGSKDIGANCLKYLIDRSTELNIDICGLISRKSETGKQILAIGERFNIPILPSLDEMPECDIIYSVQYHELLRQKDIDKAHIIAVNLHLAPLPEYRGCNQFSFAILEEAKEFGVTIHQIDTRIDHGAILFEKRFSIPEKYWVKELFDMAEDKGIELFKESLPYLISGDYIPSPQLEIEGRAPSKLYFREEIRKIKEISLDLSEEEIAKRIRATMMPGFEPPYCLIDGKKVYFSLGK